MLLNVDAIPKWTNPSTEKVARWLRCDLDAVECAICQGIDDAGKFVYTVQHRIGNQLVQSMLWVNPFDSSDIKVGRIGMIQEEKSNA